LKEKRKVRETRQSKLKTEMIGNINNRRFLVYVNRSRYFGFVV
jgi:hypothetical protein